MSWEEIGTLVGMLLAVAGVLLLAWFCTRYLAGRGLVGGIRRRAGGRAGNIRILERQPLGREQYLAVARVGRRCFLLGVTASQITLLRELDEGEAEQWRQEDPPPDGPQDGAPVRFQDAFREALRQKKQK